MGDVKLAGPMWRALELAWEAYRARSLPIGAVLVDGVGAVIAEGRNRIGELDGPPGRLRNTALAHAEMDVLAQLPLGSYESCTLFTSLEPCLLCRSATVMPGVGTVRFLGRDALCEGLDRLADVNDHARRRHPTMRGPEHNVWARFATVLPLAILCALDRDGASMAAHRRHAPPDAAAAERIVVDGLWPSRRLDLVDAVAWLRPVLAG
ncbi:MAG: nucleoside deaminase [Ilumatobacteraceae bacterium]